MNARRHWRVVVALVVLLLTFAAISSVEASTGAVSGWWTSTLYNIRVSNIVYYNDFTTTEVGIEESALHVDNDGGYTTDSGTVRCYHGSGAYACAGGNDTDVGPGGYYIYRFTFSPDVDCEKRTGTDRVCLVETYTWIGYYTGIGWQAFFRTDGSTISFYHSD